MANIGGIAGENLGRITDCYVIWNRPYHNEDKHLIAENNGQLMQAVLIEKGKCLEIIGADGRKRVDYPIESGKDLYKLGFSRDKWEYSEDKYLVRFVDKSWQHAVANIENRHAIHIQSVGEYIEMAEEISKGNTKYTDAYIAIDCDLDFRGKSIPIIAPSKEHPFTGIFDGKGHMIWNGTISDKESNYVAMFGYNQGRIFNVTFDGRCASEKNTAGICGVNRGSIDCCAALVRVDTKGDSASGAGIATINEGSISSSYAVFEPRKALPVWLFIALFAALALFIGILGFATISVALGADKQYMQIENDETQVRTPGPKTVSKGDGHSLTFTLEENVTISREEGLVHLSFANPSNDNCKLVAELQIEDEDGNRITVASSGAVLPGYEISQMTLTDDASILTGEETSGYIQLVPYDKSTEAKGMVQVDLPVTITYED